MRRHAGAAAAMTWRAGGRVRLVRPVRSGRIAAAPAALCPHPNHTPSALFALRTEKKRQVGSRRTAPWRHGLPLRRGETRWCGSRRPRRSWRGRAVHRLLRLLRLLPPPHSACWYLSLSLWLVLSAWVCASFASSCARVCCSRDKSRGCCCATGAIAWPTRWEASPPSQRSSSRKVALIIIGTGG
jgi:hypothetical protein